jgi:NADH dehydrogenase
MTAALPHRVVLVGAGFGGLYAAKALKGVPAGLTVIDRRNSPIRHGLSGNRHARVWLAEVRDIHEEHRRLLLDAGEIEYDTLILATGAHHHYFGHDDWEALAPGLKTIEDATAIRSRILQAFESAEREPDSDERRAWLTFVIIGAGPTGVELAGALGEIANDTLRHDFRSINPTEANILLLEGGERVLPSFPTDLGMIAERDLVKLGVRSRTGAVVIGLDNGGVTVRASDLNERIAAKTVLWAAGVQAGFQSGAGFSPNRPERRWIAAAV